MYRIIIVLTLLVISSCSTPKVPAAGQVHLRYRNISPENFRLLETEIFGKTYTFNNVAPGAVTGFITLPKANTHHYARVVTGSDTLVLPALDVSAGHTYTNGYLTLALDIAKDEKDNRTLMFIVNGAERDYHTTATDVIDNMFIFLNDKDWQTVNSFYSSAPVITGLENQRHNGLPSDYFKSMFEKEEVNYIYVQEQKIVDGNLFVKAFTRKGRRSAEYPLCYLFTIRNNRITEQKAISCDR